MHSQNSLHARVVSPAARTRLWWEVAIVLALSFGASGVYAIISIIERTTRSSNLASQTSTITRSLADRQLFDVIYQLLSITTALVPVALVVWLVWDQTKPHLSALGLGSFRQGWIKNTSLGFALALSIGVPGLVFYIVTKELGFNTTVVPTSLDSHWWTVPILILTALRAAVSEEIIVVAYLFLCLRQLGWSAWSIILASALLRGSYHLYQGFGGALGNVIMGVVFGWVYHRWGRIMPLVVAHLLLDIVSFVGYPLAVMWWPQFCGCLTRKVRALLPLLRLRQEDPRFRCIAAGLHHISRLVSSPRALHHYFV